MGYSFRCENVIPGCEGEVHGETREATMEAVADHAADAHGLVELDDATIEKVKAGITAD